MLCAFWTLVSSCGDTAAASANGVAKTMTRPKAITLLIQLAENLICHPIPSSLALQNNHPKAVMP
jgi:hypothetical protein